LVSSMDYDDYVGRIAVGKINRVESKPKRIIPKLIEMGSQSLFH
jgi:predicted membrane GTPase involved in stress response